MFAIIHYGIVCRGANCGALDGLLVNRRIALSLLLKEILARRAVTYILQRGECVNGRRVRHSKESRIMNIKRIAVNGALLLLAVAMLWSYLPQVRSAQAAGGGCIRIEVVDQDQQPVNGFAVTVHDLQPGQSGMPRLIYSGENSPGVTVIGARTGLHQLSGNDYQYAGDSRIFSGLSQMFMQLSVFENANCATAWFQIEVTESGPVSPLAVPATNGKFMMYLPKT